MVKGRRSDLWIQQFLLHHSQAACEVQRSSHEASWCLVYANQHHPFIASF